ncbi:hypothetical protein HMI56_006505 [Coelomomyces lativittatus]|nr:hypothetical protein HMI56_006505 [Coelomomyces lativittatus]
MGPSLFELEKLAYMTERYPKPSKYIENAIQNIHEKLQNDLICATKALEKAPTETLKIFDQIFYVEGMKEELKFRQKTLQNFILVMMIEVLIDHQTFQFEDIINEINPESLFQPIINPYVFFILRNEKSIDFIEFRRNVHEIIGKQEYDSITLPLSIWTDKKTNKMFQWVYHQTFSEFVIMKFFKNSFVSKSGTYDGHTIFKDIAHHLLPCLHNINEIKKKAQEYLSQEDIKVVAVPKCKSILMDIKAVYSTLDAFELYKAIRSGKKLTNVEHRYWQLRFLQVPQLLILEWVFFLNDPSISIKDASPCHYGNEDNKELLKPYLVYLEYILQQYNGM